MYIFIISANLQVVHINTSIRKCHQILWFIYDYFRCFVYLLTHGILLNQKWKKKENNAERCKSSEVIKTSKKWICLKKKANRVYVKRLKQTVTKLVVRCDCKRSKDYWMFFFSIFKCSSKNFLSRRSMKLNANASVCMQLNAHFVYECVDFIQWICNLYKVSTNR